MKWRVYWTSLILLLLGVSLLYNKRKYPDKSTFWLLWKSAADCGLIGFLAWLCPALLIAFISMWVLEHVKTDSILKTIAGVLTGLGLSALAGWFLEVILLLGIFGINIFTSKWLENWKRYT